MVSSFARCAQSPINRWTPKLLSWDLSTTKIGPTGRSPWCIWVETQNLNSTLASLDWIPLTWALQGTLHKPLVFTGFGWTNLGAINKGQKSLSWITSLEGCKLLTGNQFSNSHSSNKLNRPINHTLILSNMKINRITKLQVAWKNLNLLKMDKIQVIWNRKISMPWRLRLAPCSQQD